MTTALNHLQTILALLIIICCAAYWADGIMWVLQEPQEFWECFKLVLGLFKEMLIG